MTKLYFMKYELVLQRFGSKGMNLSYQSVQNIRFTYQTPMLKMHFVTNPDFFLQGSLPQPHLSQSLDGAVDSTSTTYRSKLEKESVPSVGEEHLWSLGLNISFHVCHLIILPEFDCCAWISWEDTSPLRGV